MTIKKRKPKSNQMELLMKALSSFYQGDALMPGVNLAYLGEVNRLVGRKTVTKPVWHGSISRYVHSIEGDRSKITRLTPIKARGNSIEEVVSQLSLEWYGSVTRGLSKLDQLGFNPEVKS